MKRSGEDEKKRVVGVLVRQPPAEPHTKGVGQGQLGKDDNARFFPSGFCKRFFDTVPSVVVAG